MARYRKKPVVIEAEQFTGEPLGDLRDVRYGVERTPVPQLVITTLEGEMRADVGDWIITGVKGERYPCKPDIFAATYDAVDA